MLVLVLVKFWLLVDIYKMYLFFVIKNKMILYEFFFKVNKVMLLFIIKSIKLFINVEWIF